MDKREKAKALDAKAKKKSASSAASKDEKKKDKVRRAGSGEGGDDVIDRCDWFATTAGVCSRFRARFPAG